MTPAKAIKHFNLSLFSREKIHTNRPRVKKGIIYCPVHCSGYHEDSLVADVRIVELLIKVKTVTSQSR